MPIKDSLDKLMRSAGISQSELADRTGVPQPTIHRILAGESKDPRHSTVKLLAGFFGTTAARLRGDDLAPEDVATRVMGTGTLSERIKVAMDAAEINQSDLAHCIGVSSVSVNNWCTGATKTIKGVNLLKASRRLKVNAMWLASGVGPMQLDGALALDTNISHGPDISGMVPLISWGQVAGGFSSSDVKGWLPCLTNMGPSAFALRVCGASMEPRYQDGDIIFVDPDVPPTNGRNVVVYMEDEGSTTFRHLIIDEIGNKYLKSLNPDWPGLKITQANSSTRICGVVVGKWVLE